MILVSMNVPMVLNTNIQTRCPLVHSQKETGTHIYKLSIFRVTCYHSISKHALFQSMRGQNKRFRPLTCSMLPRMPRRTIKIRSCRRCCWEVQLPKCWELAVGILKTSGIFSQANKRREFFREAKKTAF